MILFCPTCQNLLLAEKDVAGIRFYCSTCPFVRQLKRITERTYPILKNIDQVMGGTAAWENVDSTDAECPTCNHKKAYFMQMQTRSADEPMTNFFKCCNPTCGHTWRD